MTLVVGENSRCHFCSGLSKDSSSSRGYVPAFHSSAFISNQQHCKRQRGGTSSHRHTQVIICQALQQRAAPRRQTKAPPLHWEEARQPEKQRSKQQYAVGSNQRQNDNHRQRSVDSNRRQRIEISRPQAGQQIKQAPYATDKKLSKREKQRAASEPPQRLHKVIAAAGIASKRASEAIVQSGEVRVNGKVVLHPGQPVIASVDEITVKGRPLPSSTKKYYFALNKPKGFLCSNTASRAEGQNQKLVVDLLQPWLEREWKPKHTHPNALPPRLFTVGRLDVPTTGLLFITNDGAWSQRIQHPSNGLTKEYVATTSELPTRKQLEGIAAGTYVDGAFVQPQMVSPALQQKSNKIRIVVGEGRNREVRVLLENVGLTVTGLKRVRIGGYRLPQDLAIGEVRELKNQVIKRVTDKSVELNPEANPTTFR